MNEHEEQYEALRTSYLRLRVCAQRVIDETAAAGTAEAPLCGVPPHAIRALRRELDGEPTPQGLTFMSIT